MSPKNVNTRYILIICALAEVYITVYNIYMQYIIASYIIYYHNITYDICAILLHQSYRYASVNSSSTPPPPPSSAAAFSAQERFVGCGRWAGGLETPRGWFTHDSRVFMVVLVFYWSFNKLDLACQYVYVAVVGTTTSLIL